MIPLWISIGICREQGRFFRLWLPLFLLWILLLPVAILALPVLLVVCLMWGWELIAWQLAFLRLLSGLRGTAVDIDHPHGLVSIRIV